MDRQGNIIDSSQDPQVENNCYHTKEFGNISIYVRLTFTCVVYDNNVSAIWYESICYCYNGGSLNTNLCTVLSSMISI